MLDTKNIGFVTKVTGTLDKITATKVRNTKMISLEWLVLTAVSLVYGAYGKSDGPREYCFPAGFNASCGPNDVILMKSARYGRMKEGQCIQSSSHVGCWADVLTNVDRICSGRHQCQINIPDGTLHNLQPCPKDMLAYIEADYECLPIHREPSWDCHPAADLIMPGPSGYLASISTIETGLGSRNCPWKITVAPGQRINVTLMDFGVISRSGKGGSMCQVYAKIKEQGMASAITVCGGQQRERGVYVSETNEIEAVMLTSREEQGDEDSPVYFVLKYDVVGCTDPVVPQGAWLKRTNDKAAIYCNHTTQVWHIVCHGNDWFGKMENCSSLATNGQSDGLASSKGDFPYGLMVAVVTGLVLGVLIGVALLAMVIVCHKRKRRRSNHPPADSQEAVLETVQGTPFLREKQGHKPNEPIDSGYGYTHVCDVTIYQPYTQRQQMSSFRNDVTKPPMGNEADNVVQLQRQQQQQQQQQQQLQQQQRAQDLYEKPGFRKPSIVSTPGREPRFYSDFDMDHNINTGSPAHKIIYPSDSKLNSPCEH